MSEPFQRGAHALVVGIDAYERARRLPATSDAADLSALLVDPAACGYAPEDVTLLTNAQATGAALRAALGKLAERAPTDGTAFVFFSGHGGRIATATGAADYLLPVDADPASPEALAASALAGPELAALLAAIPTSRLVVVLDCCHA